ncbi:MAG: hypothetical protein RR136_00485 [Clostridia bacterium]
MRWGDIKTIAIQKMFLTDDIYDYDSLQVKSNDGNIQPYLQRMISAANEGLYRIYSYGYPKYTYTNGIEEKVKVEQLKFDVKDEYVMTTYEEALLLLPLYIASQVYKDDDIGLATGYRNEFEVGLEELAKNIENNQIQVIYNMEV